MAAAWSNHEDVSPALTSGEVALDGVRFCGVDVQVSDEFGFPAGDVVVRQVLNAALNKYVLAQERLAGEPAAVTGEDRVRRVS